MNRNRFWDAAEDAAQVTAIIVSLMIGAVIVGILLTFLFEIPGFGPFLAFVALIYIMAFVWAYGDY